ncbi:MAG: DUF5565 family protein [Acidobacteriota bacterium]
MKKIPSLFLRDFDGDPSRVTKVSDPSCDWVFNHEGKATRKWDGTACLIRDGLIFKRLDLKRNKKTGKRKERPDGWEPSQDPDEKTGHWPGWMWVGDGPEDIWHRIAFEKEPNMFGSCELIGPKINGNPEREENHRLVPHGTWIVGLLAVNFEDIRSHLWVYDYLEGIVWHHPDGRMAKIKRRDFGFQWPIKQPAHRWAMDRDKRLEGMPQ